MGDSVLLCLGPVARAVEAKCLKIYSERYRLAVSLEKKRPAKDSEIQ
jgi:hypothetical protein